MTEMIARASVRATFEGAPVRATNNKGPFRIVIVAATIHALLAISAVPARGQDEIPINSRWLGERVFITWACDYFQGTNMAVLVSREGLVIIDTGLSPTMVRRQRALIERELGRSDFRYLINTHTHNDHAFANEVFPEATVIAPEVGPAALQREIELIPELLERLHSSYASYREWAAETPPDSLEGIQAREGVAAFEVGIADLEAGIEPRFPSVTFSDRYTLDLGDLTLELYTFAGFHSDSDILILVPEERILFTGDVFWGGQLPLLSEEAIGNFPRVLNTWETILAVCPDLEILVPGHSDVPLTLDQFHGVHAYFSRLWSDVEAARQAAMPLVMFLLQNEFRTRYPEVADWRFIAREWNFHQHNLYLLWQLAGR